jgi:hypothetical protein
VQDREGNSLEEQGLPFHFLVHLANIDEVHIRLSPSNLWPGSHGIRVHSCLRTIVYNESHRYSVA